MRLPTCRFSPTCSQYAVEALAEYGLVQGRLVGRSAAGEVRAVASWRMGPDPQATTQFTGTRPGTTAGIAQRSEGRTGPVFDPVSLDYHLLPGFGDHVGLVQGVCRIRVLGPQNFFTWALSVMFLVFTLRAILYKPFVRQIRTTRQMQEMQPQIKALQKKYGKDRQRFAMEMQKLQRTRVQPGARMPADARADPGVPRPVPRADVVQPDKHGIGRPGL